MPNRIITPWDRSLAGTVQLRISSRFTCSKPNSSAALAASVANPFPHSSRAKRQPISTAGVK